MSAFRASPAFQPSDSNHPTFLPLTILTAGAVEEGIALSLGHGRDGSCLTLVLPLLRPSADGLTGELGE
jgi:hypothetical protein